MINQSQDRDWKSAAEDTYVYARRSGAAHHDAEDHSQEIVRAKIAHQRRQNCSKPDAGDVSSALLYTSARHEVARAARRRVRERQVHTEACSAVGLNNEVGRCERLVSAELDVLIERVFTQLRVSRNPRDAEVLAIVHCMTEEMSSKQMATWLGCSRRTVYRMLERATARLSQLVRDEATTMGLDDMPREIRNAVLAMRARL